MSKIDLTTGGLKHWLSTDDPEQLKLLWSEADKVRAQQVGQSVHLRGLVEFTNVCRRGCTYCGLRASNSAIKRYRMSAEEILICAEDAVELGYGTLVLQGGEDPMMTAAWLTDVIRSIKSSTDLAITLSVGEYSVDDYRRWRDAGANRVLLRFETSNQRIYNEIHPDFAGVSSDRPELLLRLRKEGYEIGSGVMVGLPSQTVDDLVGDLELFVELDLDMVGLGPFIPNADTPLGCEARMAKDDIYIKDTALMTYKMMALTRLLLPKSNIPSTTALATLSGDSMKGLGLIYGANVIMPNLTPSKYRDNYSIYPGKGATQSADEYDRKLKETLASMGRSVAVGPGHSPAYTQRGIAPVGQRRIY